jgi:large subunit ribosomal protein L19
MSNYVENFNKKQAEEIRSSRSFEVPNFSAGDTLKVSYNISEGSTTRVQSFMGVVIAKSKSQSNYNATFTVRKISASIGVERRFPIYSPLLTNIEVLKRGVVRRAKLYYLRELTGKASRIKERLDFSNDKNKSSKDKNDSSKQNNDEAKNSEVKKENNES